MRWNSPSRVPLFTPHCSSQIWWTRWFQRWHQFRDLAIHIHIFLLLFFFENLVFFLSILDCYFGLVLCWYYQIAKGVFTWLKRSPDAVTTAAVVLIIRLSNRLEFHEKITPQKRKSDNWSLMQSAKCIAPILIPRYRSGLIHPSSKRCPSSKKKQNKTKKNKWTAMLSPVGHRWIWNWWKVSRRTATKFRNDSFSKQKQNGGSSSWKQKQNGGSSSPWSGSDKTKIPIRLL